MGKERRSILVFDMDGVLVDVTESYRDPIVATVEHFTGGHDLERRHPGLQERRRLEQRLGAVPKVILDTDGPTLPFDDIVGVFQRHLLRHE